MSDTLHHAADTIKHAGEAVKHKTSEVLHGAKGDAHMANAKDPNLTAGTRISQGASGVKERVQETVAGGQKEVAKTKGGFT